MADEASRVYAFLDGLGIDYRVVGHAPTATMAECARIDRTLGAMTAKNIFLTTKNRKRFYLCLIRPEARFVTSDISRQVGSSRLSFAPEELLFEKLRCHGGSASPLGLIFPEAREVGLIVDSALRDCDTLAFHPCDNRYTLAMAGRDFFERFLPAAEARVMDVRVEELVPEAQIDDEDL